MQYQYLPEEKEKNEIFRKFCLLLTRLKLAKQIISVFRVTGLKILGRVGTKKIFSEKIYNFMHFERPFKMHKIIFFPENLTKIQGFTSTFR